METFAPGARVERVNSPADSLVKDGAVGAVLEVLQSANGELGCFVRFSPGSPPVFCAASRLRAITTT